MWLWKGPKTFQRLCFRFCLNTPKEKSIFLQTWTFRWQIQKQMRRRAQHFNSWLSKALNVFSFFFKKREKFHFYTRKSFFFLHGDFTTLTGFKKVSRCSVEVMKIDMMLKFIVCATAELRWTWSEREKSICTCQCVSSNWPYRPDQHVKVQKGLST